MAVAVEAEQIQIKRTGFIVEVPDNPWAKLMYYLSCVDNVIDFGIPKQLIDYKNYKDNTFENKNKILLLAEVMFPKFFDEKCVFIQDDSLCLNSSNEFYEISHVKCAVAITENFFIAGKQVRTLKIMSYKNKWATKNYYEPMEYFSKRLSSIHDGTAEKYRNADSATCLLI